MHDTYDICYMNSKYQPKTSEQQTFTKAPSAQQSELLRLIQQDIDYHYRRSSKLKARAYFFKISVMVLAATVTILLGLKLSDGNKFDAYISNIALMLGAVITLISGIGSFWNTEKYWLNNTLTMMKLITLKNEFILELKAEEGIGEEKYKLLKETFSNIQTSKIDYWEDATNQD